ncbi:MAG TPA: hypothetical protein VJG30_04960 [Candidatus Nanoarchaeia archaeon]|nr:hypothetical protein [Candidatus Nanoarchaeia archaeon]
MDFWIGVIILFLWFLAKDLGYINTPAIIKAIPYGVGLVTLMAVVKKLGEYSYKVDTVVIAVKEIRDDVHSLDNRVSLLENNFSSLDRRFSVIESRI